MHISVSSPDDIGQLAYLINNAYRGEESKKGWTTEAYLLEGERTNQDTLLGMMLLPNALFLKYEDDKCLKGCVFLEKRGYKMYLGMLSVMPLEQAKGIGRKLLHEADVYARHQQCKLIEITVLSVRTELLEWYKRHGFEETGEVVPYAGEGIHDTKGPLQFLVLQKELGTSQTTSFMALR